MSDPITRWIALLVAGIALAAAGCLGWSTGRAPLLTQLAQRETAYAREKLRTSERTAEVLQAANDRGDQLVTGLELRQADINQLAREKRDAIHQVTTGRACLGGSALRVLNSAPGLSVRGLAPTVGGVAATGAAPATDTDIGGVGDITNIVSTDTDIATWAIDAGAQYEVCRARLDALIDWHLQPTPNATAPAPAPAPAPATTETPRP
jgi:hypothetical protein